LALRERQSQATCCCVAHKSDELQGLLLRRITDTG
jgi:hypothetical protein